MFFKDKNRKKYLLAPQTKFYDSMAAKWKPFIMFNQYPNIRSQYCNTDIFGMRFNNLTDKHKKISIFNQYPDSNKEGAVIIGNSLSFGEGQSSDKKTISNILTENTKYNFYNLSGRGFSGYQELNNFLILKHKIKNLKKIIIISGLNDSILPFFIKDYESEQAPIFGYDRYTNVMRSSAIGWKNKLAKFLLNPFLKKKNEYWERANHLNWREEIFGENYNFEEHNDKLTSLQNMEDIMKRNIQIWSNLAKGMDIEIDFILQPVGSWCKDVKTSEEEKIFQEEDQITYLYNIYKHVELEKYSSVKKILEKTTRKNFINFIDMNEIFNQEALADKWLFTSKFHVTDLGSKIIAENLINKLF
tara:strand:+ start:3311 stop:4387 length:1077 start_codon:yes stop_codon:yes gene_type:complete